MTFPEKYSLLAALALCALFGSGCSDDPHCGPNENYSSRCDDNVVETCDGDAGEWVAEEKCGKKKCVEDDGAAWCE